MTRIGRGPALVLALLVVVALVAGAAAVWRTVRGETTYPPATPLAHQCDEVPASAERIVLRADDGRKLGGVLVGPTDARVGLVLRQGASQTICEWLPWADEVAEASGVRVLLFDRRGRGSSPGSGDLTKEPADLADAVRELRGSGVEDVVLVGSSMGNSVMYAGLDLLDDPPCAVVSISPVLVSADGNGTVDGTRMTGLPDNVWVTWEGRNDGVAANAELIGRRAREQGRQPPHELEVDTADHSRQLVLRHASVREFLTRAVSSCRAVTR